MFVEKTFDTGEVILNYAEGPTNGPPLLMLHGGAMEWQGMRTQLEYFSPQWHVYAPDLRGCGKSGHVPRGYRFSDWTRDMVALIRTRIMYPVVLLGFSGGANIAAQLAAELPENVCAAILAEPPLYLDEFLEDSSFYRYVHVLQEIHARAIVEELSAEDVAPIFLEQLGGDLEIARARAAVMLRRDLDLGAQILEKTSWDGFDADTLLEHISCPVLLIHGEFTRGSVLRPEDIARAAARIRNGKVVGMKETVHNILFSDAETFNQIVAEFLEAL